jgi:hypothetical protein
VILQVPAYKDWAQEVALTGCPAIATGIHHSEILKLHPRPSLFMREFSHLKLHKGSMVTASAIALAAYILYKAIVVEKEEYTSDDFDDSMNVVPMPGGINSLSSVSNQ